MADNKEYEAHDVEGSHPLMVHVTAPTSLPEGYSFEAVLADGTPFSCKVPEGGVEEGQTFWVPLPLDIETNRISAPTGRWKDGLFDFLSLGCFHPSFLCACCCSTISMAQIMTRLHLTWLGLPGPQIATKNTFKVVLMILAAYVVYSTSLELASMPYDPENLPPVLWALKSLGSTAFSVYSIFSLCNTRRSVRIQYSIPEQQCHGYEDVVCACCCTCCVLAQMARHTGEYETYPGKFLTKTGHPVGTPLTV
ncbi:unnamed protein product [Cylindrotheca closterium]|uniref:Uncharacterized protein n=1 Tax=Cylindrotheca closterium TaxID=2856 RepID=A0AAD2G2N1_9STRA|nr:unnamed protein product [Cylindrotheca closterium]